MKKTIATKTATVSHSILGQAVTGSVTDPVPTTRAPSPPETYVPTKLGRGARPQRTQVAAAPKMASELRESASYSELFGSGVPDAATVADALTNASGWTGVVQNAVTWCQYAKQQESLAWKHATGLTDTLRVPFDFRNARDATIAESLPSTAKFFGAPKESAQKGVATRKKNRAEKAKAAAAPSPPPPTVNAAGAKLLN
jgi:hypothetical protein